MVAGQVLVIAASLAAIPFGALGAQTWAGTCLVVWALELFVSAAFLALASIRNGNIEAARDRLNGTGSRIAPSLHQARWRAPG